MYHTVSRSEIVNIRRLRISDLIMLSASLLVACSRGPVPAPVTYSPDSPLLVKRAPVKLTKTPEYHRVQKGDTLYSIAFDYGLDTDDVATWNGVAPPFIIYPDQLLRMKPYPNLVVKTLETSGEPPVLQGSIDKSRKSRGNSAKLLTKPTDQTKKVEQKTAVSEINGSDRTDESTGPNTYVSTNSNSIEQESSKKSVTKWVWPVKGSIIKGFSSSKRGGKGLDIAGRIGTPVRAAAKGRVVYRGSSLRGYGQLVIVKHSDSLLSAYAHNSKILVTENEVVKPGQVIAEMGDSGTNRVKLHFEIRRKGRPVDPLTFLPNL